MLYEKNVPTKEESSLVWKANRQFYMLTFANGISTSITFFLDSVKMQRSSKSS